MVLEFKDLGCFGCYSGLTVSLREAIVRAIIICPVLEYCSPVWMSAATSHLLLLDSIVDRVSKLAVEESAVIFGTGTKWHL